MGGGLIVLVGLETIRRNSAKSMKIWWENENICDICKEKVEVTCCKTKYYNHKLPKMYHAKCLGIKSTCGECVNSQ